MDAPPPDPHQLLLCQIPGLPAHQLRQLVDTWGEAAAVSRAPVGALREAGLPPATVARIAAVSRQLPTALAGIKGLTRLNIMPVPCLSPAYPARLWDLALPPLLLYVQGAWPPAHPMVAVFAAPEAPPAAASALREWLALLGPLGVRIAASRETLELVPPEGTLAVAPFGLMLARQRVSAGFYKVVQSGGATIVSAAAVNAPPDDQSEGQARTLLLAFADAQLLLDETPASASPDLPAFLLELAPPTSAVRSKHGRRLRANKQGARQLARALGMHATSDGIIQQERLF